MQGTDYTTLLSLYHIINSSGCSYVVALQHESDALDKFVRGLNQLLGDHLELKDVALYSDLMAKH